MSYYDDALIKIAEIVGDAGDVKSINEPSRGTYTILVAFTYPWNDPIGIENYYLKIQELVGLEGDGRVRLAVEPYTTEPSKLLAKITVVFKTVYHAKMQAKELQ